MTARMSISVGGAGAVLIQNAGGGDCGFYSLIDGFKLAGLPISDSVLELRKQFVQFVYDHYEYCYLIFSNCVADPTHVPLLCSLNAYYRTRWCLVIGPTRGILQSSLTCSNGRYKLRTCTRFLITLTMYF
jgi:hypothetical protein